MMIRPCPKPVAPFLLALLMALAFTARPAAAQAPDPETVRRAEAGDAHAQLVLGHAYMLGRGVPEDPTEAARWLRKAADQGNATAQFALGTLYQWGRGVLQNEATAVSWFTKAAEQGVIGAQGTLGEMYRDGKGVKKDDVAAVKWFRRAAEGGDAIAQFNLGVAYRTGRGVARDPVEAHKWIMLAAAREKSAETADRFVIARDNHAAELTKAQAADAQKRAQDWMDAHEAKAAGGVAGGIPGGVVGGIPGGVVGGVVGGLPEAPPPPEAVRVGGQIKEPRKVKHVNPVYPDIAKMARVQGVVILEVTINPNGQVNEVTVLRGIPLLDQAAIDAVKQWVYTPTLLNGVPVPVIMTVTVNFRLGDPAPPPPQAGS